MVPDMTHRVLRDQGPHRADLANSRNWSLRFHVGRRQQSKEGKGESDAAFTNTGKGRSKLEAGGARIYLAAGALVLMGIYKSLLRIDPALLTPPLSARLSGRTGKENLVYRLKTVRISSRPILPLLTGFRYQCPPHFKLCIVYEHPAAAGYIRALMIFATLDPMLLMAEICGQS